MKERSPHAPLLWVLEVKEAEQEPLTPPLGNSVPDTLPDAWPDKLILLIANRLVPTCSLDPLQKTVLEEPEKEIICLFF